MRSSDLYFLAVKLPLPSLIVMVYGSVILALAERGHYLRATFVIMVASWLIGVLKEQMLMLH